MTTVPTCRAPWTRTATIGSFGGALDKENCTTEEEPYAYTWYREYTEMLPDSLTEGRTGLVHARKLAKSRLQSSVTRTVERAINNAFPDTADELLDKWGTFMEVPFTSDKHVYRQRCGSKYSSQRGSTAEIVDEVLAQALGSRFVRTVRQRTDDLTNDTDIAFWVGGTAGPAEYNLGNGTWISHRAHIGVIVNRSPETDGAAFYQEMNDVVNSSLQYLIGAHVTYAWATSEGFILDVSELDFSGLGD